MNNTHRLTTIFFLIFWIRRFFFSFVAFSYLIIRFNTRITRSMIWRLAIFRIFSSLSKEVKLINLFRAFLMFVFWLKSKSVFRFSCDFLTRSIWSRLFCKTLFLSSRSSFDVDKNTFKRKMKKTYLASW